MNLSKSKLHIVFTETEFDELGLGMEQKIAVIPIDPTKDPEAILEKARQVDWQFVGEKRTDGFYSIARV